MGDCHSLDPGSNPGPGALQISFRSLLLDAFCYIPFAGCGCFRFFNHSMSFRFSKRYFIWSHHATDSQDPILNKNYR